MLKTLVENRQVFFLADNLDDLRVGMNEERVSVPRELSEVGFFSIRWD